MKKILSILLAGTVLLTGCGATNSFTTQEGNELIITSSPMEEQYSGTPYSLELVFGNGETLKKEMTLLAMPRVRYSGAGGTLVYFDYIALQDYEKSDVEFLDGLFGLEESAKPKATSLPLSSVIFEDGTLYALGEAYKADVDRDSRILRVWLWRDEPYEQERQYFNNTAATTE